MPEAEVTPTTVAPFAKDTVCIVLAFELAKEANETALVVTPAESCQ